PTTPLSRPTLFPYTTLFRSPAHWKVLRHVRPKLACRCCERIVQMPAPGRPVERSFAGPGLLAHVLVSKYADHLPLYRQSAIYARDRKSTRLNSSHVKISYAA